MRIILAFQCFWLILLGKKLPDTVAPYVPEGLTLEAGPAPAQLTSGVPDVKVTKPIEPVKPEPAPAVVKENRSQLQRDGALALLSLLQREGRLVDFLREGLDGHDDASIGAAVREVHRGCKKVLDEHFAFEPMLPGEEEAAVTVPRGFDPAEIRLIGETKGEPPFKGTLRHHGWRATSAKLPGLADGVDRTVIAPAEVEVS